MYVLDQDFCKNTLRQWVVGRDGAALCRGGWGRSCPSPSLVAAQEGATKCGLQTPGPCSLAAVQVLGLKTRCPQGRAACRGTWLTSLSFWWWPKPWPSWAARCTRGLLGFHAPAAFSLGVPLSLCGRLLALRVSVSNAPCLVRTAVSGFEPLSPGGHFCRDPASERVTFTDVKGTAVLPFQPRLQPSERTHSRYEILWLKPSPLCLTDQLCTDPVPFSAEPHKHALFSCNSQPGVC